MNFPKFARRMRDELEGTTVAPMLAAICLGMLGCAEVGAVTDGADTQAEPSAKAEQPVTVVRSDQQAPTDEWSVDVRDTFFMELPNWRIHNNGCVGSCSVRLWVVLRKYLDGQEVETEKLASETYSGPDARDYDWVSLGKSFTVERLPNACFMLDMWATHIPHGTWAQPKYCWDVNTHNWEPKSSDAAPIGPVLSSYKYESIDFDITFRHRLLWKETNMSGVLLQNTRSTDGTDWQHLLVTMWNNPRSVNVALYTDYGDADLYLRYPIKPTLDEYLCRPYAGGTTSESCLYGGAGPLWASAHNYLTADASVYHMTITPQF